ncbi:MAG: hypothetical protein K0V04_25795, partial [Deltaproteobacteria bacterium]|nr:hypothetical protein [Deltaproteobacteria bacterium]
VVALLLATAGPPAASEADAEAGVAAFAEGRYDDAARILERAYAAEPRPDLLFAWAQAERYAERCSAAVPLFRQFLDLEPTQAIEDKAREAIEACGEDPDAVPAPPPEPEEVRGPQPPPEVGPKPEPDPPVAPVAPEPEPRPVALDPWGHALVWSGVAVAGVGAGLLGEAHLRRVAARDATDEQMYRADLDGAPILSRTGIGLVVGGGALLVAGIVRFSVLVARRRRSADTLAAVRRGAGLTWHFSLAPRRRWALR